MQAMPAVSSSARKIPQIPPNSFAPRPQTIRHSDKYSKLETDAISGLSRSTETDQLPGQLVDHRFGETKIIFNDASRVSSKPGRKVYFRVNRRIEYKEQSQRLASNLFNIVTKTLLNEAYLTLTELRGFGSRVGSEYRYTRSSGKNELP